MATVSAYILASRTDLLNAAEEANLSAYTSAANLDLLRDSAAISASTLDLLKTLSVAK